MISSNETRSRPRALIALFWAQVATFALMLGTIFLPFFQAFFRPAFLALMGACFILGLALSILSARARPIGALKRFLILTGASSAGLTFFSALHNAFYALATLAGEQPLLEQAMKGLEAAFFIIGILVCPVGFLVGTVGAIVILLRKGKQGSPA
jgi:hypothetical protein